MRKVSFFLSVALCLALASCQPGADDILPPTQPEEPGSSQKKLFEVEYTDVYVGSSSGNLSGRGVVLEDTMRHTITFMEDSAKEIYSRYFYDADGLLQKIRYNKYDTAHKEIDSVVFQRRGAGVVDINYSWGVSLRCTPSTLANGTKQYAYTYLSAPVTGHIFKKMFIDDQGLLRQVIYDQEQSGSITNVHYFYDAANKLTERRDTDFNYQANTFTRRFNITKDNNPNTFMISFYKKVLGPDLAWLLYDRQQAIVPFTYDFNFLDSYSYLLNGSISSYVYSATDASDGINFQPVAATPDTYNFQNNYDAKGRMIYHEIKKPWEEHRLKFIYPD